MTLKVFLTNLKLWFLWYPIRLLTRITPTFFPYQIAEIFSRFWYTLDLRKVDHLRKSLRSILGTSDNGYLAEVIRKGFALKIQNEIDALLYPQITRDNFRDHVSIEGLEYVDKALKKEKGVVICHTHFCNPQILMLGLGYSGYSISQIAGNPVKDWADLFDRKLTGVEHKVARMKLACEGSLPAKFIYVSQPVKAAFNCIKRNEIVAAALDGGKDETRVYVRFLNRTAFFSPGPLRIAIKTGAEILPLFVLREGGFKHRIVIEPPLQRVAARDRTEQIQQLAQSFADILERYVRSHPDHYLQVLVSEHRWRFVTGGGKAV